MGKSTLNIIENQTIKKKKYSKNKKKNWKKYIDISDIQNDQHDAAQAAVEKDYIETHDADEVIFDFGEPLDSTAEEIAQPQKEKPYRCHLFVDGLPGAKPPSQPQGFARTALPKKIKIALRRSEKTPKNQKKQERAKQSKIRAKKHQKFLASREYMTTTGDIWKGKTLLGHKKNEEYKSYISEGYKHFHNVTKSGILAPRNRYHNPSDIPSVIVPDPGAAYNPSFKDHQKLMSVAVKKESVRLSKEKQEKERQKEILAHRIGKPLKIQKQPEKKLQKKAPGTKKATVNDKNNKKKPALMNSKKTKLNPAPAIVKKTVDSKQTKEVSPKEKPAADDKIVRAPAKPKTQRQRNVEAVKKSMKLRKLKAKTLKKQQDQVDKVTLIASRLDKDEARKKSLQEKKKLNKLIADRYKTKRFHSIVFKEDDLHAPLADQLVGSIREIKPTQTSARDLFTSLQRRNRLEVRAPKKKPNKKKLKLVNKRTFKSGKMSSQ